MEEIDVNGCCADKKNMKDGLYCFWEGGKCEDETYCYYKQLKRKEKECEELKKQLEAMNQMHIEKMTIIDTRTDAQKRCYEYEQALQEIKEICKEETETRMLFADKQSFCDFNKILQIINEVEK